MYEISKIPTNEDAISYVGRLDLVRQQYNKLRSLSLLRLHLYFTPMSFNDIIT